MESIRINFKGNAKKIALTLKCYNWIDKQTKQHLCYVPSLEFSAYGKTADKAQAMLADVIESYCQNLFALSVKQVHAELAQYGWKQDKLHNKNYKHAYVDANGVLQNLNVNIEDVQEASINRELTAVA
ncbi:MAG: hypothetical protein RL660_457 [Bacteroidota bacterium]|jgi:hypothetical protein